MMDSGPTSSTYYQIFNAGRMQAQMNAFINNKPMLDQFMAMFKMWDAKFYGNISDEVREVMGFFSKNYADTCKMTDCNSTLGGAAKAFLVSDNNCNDAMCFIGGGKIIPGKEEEAYAVMNDMGTVMDATHSSAAWLPQADGTMKYIEVST